MSEDHLLDQWNAIVNDPNDAIHSFVPDRLLKDLTRETINFIRKETKLYLDALFGTILTACKSIMQNEAWQAEEGLISIIIGFLVGLISSPELNCHEKRIVIDLLKRSSFHILFLHIKGIFATIIPDIMSVQTLSAISEDVACAQLLLLDCLVSGLFTSYEVIQLLYTDLSTLTTMDTMMVMNDQECEEFMKRQCPGAFSLSAFVTHQIRNGAPRCRELAYRVMGLIATRIFHRLQLGMKIVQLLLKKRVNETMDNRWVICGILWNLHYVWPDYLSSLLLHPMYERTVQGVPDSRWDLLSDLWGGDDATTGTNSIDLRKLCFLSAAQLVVSRRTPSYNPYIIRDLLISFLLRKSVERTIRNQVSQHHHQVTPQHICKKPDNRLLLQEGQQEGKNETVPAYGLALSLLTDGDAHDARLLQQVLSQGMSAGILSSHTLREVMVEAIGVSLQQTLIIATMGGGGQGTGSLNYTMVQRLLEIWFSVICQLCGTGNDRDPDIAVDAFDQWVCEQWIAMDVDVRPHETEHPRLQQKLCAAYTAHFCDNA